jgi:phosphoenolpyruvate carboxylase
VVVQDKEDMKTVQEMYREWPWFRELVDLIAMIVSKTDFSIARNYDEQLVDKSVDGLMKLGEEVRAKLVQTRQAILDVTQSQKVAGVHVALQRASSLIRHPYVDPLNVIQAELLKRLRKLEKRTDLTPEEVEEKETLQDAMILTINGIASGMKNSG